MLLCLGLTDGHMHRLQLQILMDRALAIAIILIAAMGYLATPSVLALLWPGRKGNNTHFSAWGGRK